MSRKTIKVEDLKNQVNQMLKTSDNNKEYRHGLMTVLESVLHATDNYSGFRYLLENEVPEGELPGINYEVNTRGHFVPCDDYEQRFLNTDDSRVHYY